MARPYKLKRRAEQQAQTRLRIVEAAIDLHGSVGPAATTFSMVADRAGVQRHTLYAHFPDERSLLQACSGLHGERHPLPDATPWRDIADPRQRLVEALPSIYRWFADNASLVNCVTRDAEVNPVVREINAQTFAPKIAAWHEVLGDGLQPRQRAMLTLALGFHSWQTLSRDAGLSQDQAVEAMVKAVMDA